MSTEFESIWKLHVPRLMAATKHAQQQVTQELEMHEKLAAEKSIILERFAAKKLAHVERLAATKLAVAEHATFMEEGVAVEEFMTGEFAAAGGLAAGAYATMKEDNDRYMAEMAKEQALDELDIEDVAAGEREAEDFFTIENASIVRRLREYKDIAMISHVIAKWAVEMLVFVLLRGGVFIKYFTLLQIADRLAHLSQNNARIQNNGAPLGTWK